MVSEQRTKPGDRAPLRSALPVCASAIPTDSIPLESTVAPTNSRRLIPGSWSSSCAVGFGSSASTRYLQCEIHLGPLRLCCTALCCDVAQHARPRTGEDGLDL